MTPTREQINTELKRVLVPDFRRLGFKGTFPHFYRNREGHIDLATVQFSSSGGKFVVELSYADSARKNVYIYKDTPEPKLRVAQTTNRLRLGAEAPAKDHWFECPNAGPQLTAVCSQASHLLGTQGTNWWLQQSDA